MYRNFVSAEFTYLTKQSYNDQFNTALQLITTNPAKALKILMDSEWYQWQIIIDSIHVKDIGQIASVITFLSLFLKTEDKSFKKKIKRVIKIIKEIYERRQENLEQILIINEQININCVLQILIIDKKIEIARQKWMKNGVVGLQDQEIESARRKWRGYSYSTLSVPKQSELQKQKLLAANMANTYPEKVLRHLLATKLVYRKEYYKLIVEKGADLVNLSNLQKEYYKLIRARSVYEGNLLYSTIKIEKYKSHLRLLKSGYPIFGRTNSCCHSLPG